MSESPPSAPDESPEGPPEFRPPAPEALARHLEAHPPRPGRLLWAGWLAMGGAVLLFLAALLAAHPVTWFGSMVGLAGLMGWTAWQVRRRRRAAADLDRIEERVLLRDHPRALRQAWRQVPTLATWEAWSRLLLVFARGLEGVGAWETALVAWDRFLEAHQGPVADRARCRRAMVRLRCDRLADADDDLRSVSRDGDDFVEAERLLATLFQRLVTGHHREAAEAGGEHVLETLRPLGVEAGYGHALFALACWRAEDPAAAQRAWERASRLLEPEALVRWWPPLEVLTREAGLEAVPWPNRLLAGDRHA